MSQLFYWKKLFLIIGIVGIIQFLVLTTLAMAYYPGGVLLNRSTEGYTFFTNFFSDLGRTVALNRESNTISHYLFKVALSFTGISMFFFFSVIPTLFSSKKAKGLAVFAMLLGFVAAICYVGIGFNPLNGNYWQHTFYVRIGFVAFLMSTIFYTCAIRLDDTYPNKYANMMIAFALILSLQIVIMLLGPRSWESPFALFLQVSAQKVIVYGQILCMLFLLIGAYRLVGEQNKMG